MRRTRLILHNRRRPPVGAAWGAALRAAFAKDGCPVLDVPRLFLPAAGGGGGGAAEVPEFSARTHVGGSGVDATRCFIEHITPFSENVEAEVTMTYTNGGGR